MFSLTGHILICLLGFSLAEGSVLSFTSSPREFKQGLTPSLTLNCSLSDNDNPALSHPSYHDSVKDNDDAITRCMVESRDVAHTSDNVMMLTSLVLMKDGSDIASVTSANATTANDVMDGWTNVQVTGSLAGHAGRTGFLQVTITEPTVNQTGEFVCEAATVGSTGHGVILSTAVRVSSSLPSVSDLGAYVREINRKTEDLDLVSENLMKKTADLENKIEALDMYLSQVKNRSETMVFFNARISGKVYYSPDQIVIFNDVVDSQGSDYNSNDGLFTSSISGYYHFSLGCLGQTHKRVSMKLLLNTNIVFYIYANALYNHQTGANAGTLKVMKGDVVKVKSDGESRVVGVYCTLSGHLIQPL